MKTSRLEQSEIALNKKIDKIIKLDDLYALTQVLTAANTDLEHVIKRSGVKSNESIFVRSCRFGATSIVRPLLDKNRPDMLVGLQLATKKGHYDIVKLFLEHGVNSNIVDKQNSSLLFIAMDWRWYDIAKLLLNYGADPNIVHKESGIAPIHYAVMYGIEFVKLLLQYNADPNIVNYVGSSALYETMVIENYDVAKLLLMYGARDDIQNNMGRTAYDRAIFSGDKKMIKLLNTYREINKTKNKLVPFLVLSHLYGVGSAFHEDYLCRDLFKVIMSAVKQEIALKAHKL